ncbi:MAG: hypothetical protein E7563_02855 [Ruminococcaceae bacterium]|nr:hypothetical protein [Oscillospiraceae bacterium]
MKNIKKLLSLLIVTVMLFASLPAISVSAANEYKLTLQNPCVVELSGDSTATVNFTPDEDGIYHFYSTGSYDTIATLFDSDGNEIEYNDDGKNGYNFGMYTHLEKGKNYSLLIELWSFTENAVFPVIAEKPQALTQPLTIPEDESEFLTFTPAQTGFYHIYSVGSADTCASLYDENGDEIWHNDDFTSSNFGMNYYLFEGIEYTLEIYTYSEFDEETIVCIQNSVVPEDAEVITPPINTTVIKGIEDETFTMDGIIIEFTMSDGSKYQWSYDDGGLIEGCEVETGTGFDYTGAFYANFSCEYAQALFNYKLIDNPVKSLEYIGDNIVLYENMNGYVESTYDDYDNETQFFFYYYELPLTPCLKINYTDGTNETVSLYDNELPYDLYWYHKQYDKPWTKGTDNAVMITYLGFETQVPVHVLETPVKNIEVTNTPDFKYPFGETHYGYFDSETGEYVLFPSEVNDLKFTVSYKDGTTETVIGKDVLHSDVFEVKELRVSSTGNYVAEYMYKGFTFQIEVEIIDDNTADVTGLLGDANEDSEVNIKDATLIQKNIARLATISIKGTYLADVDGDEEITIKDATAIQKYVAGITVDFPIGETL